MKEQKSSFLSCPGLFTVTAMQYLGLDCLFKEKRDLFWLMVQKAEKVKT